MKETRSISLNGLFFNVESDAYQALRDYLSDIEMRLPQDEKTDVMADVEARVGELFQKALFARNVQVVNMDMVTSVKSQIGNPSDFGENKRPHVKPSKTQNSGCSRILGITCIVVLALFALPVIVPVLACIVAVFAALIGVGVGTVGAFPLIGPILGLDAITSSPAVIVLFILSALLTISVPIVMLVHTIVMFARTRRGPKAKFWIITLIVWVLSLIGILTTTTRMSRQVGGLHSLFTHFGQMIDHIDDWDSDHGPMLTDNRTFSAFHSIDVSGAMEIHLHPSPSYAVQVESNDLQGIHTEVRDSILYLSMPDSYHNIDVDVDIYLPELRSLHGAGACDVETEELFPIRNLDVRLEGLSKAKLKIQGHSLHVALNGAGKMNLEGDVQQADISIAGAGKVESEWLNAQILHIQCAGASKAEVKAIQELWAQAAGASTITYIGSPAIKRNIAVGGSTIRHK